jgi:hypothetical protein
VGILTPDMISWSGAEAIALDPNVIEVNGSNWDNLTYLWTASPADGVVITDADQPNASVTIIKAAPTDDATVIKITLAVNNVGRVKAPVTSRITIDVYDNSCLAAQAAGEVEYDLTDIDENCITGLEDFALMATTWMVDYTPTGMDAKP